MDNVLLDEEEIKIEYNERFEEDPLRDQSVSSCQEYDEIETRATASPEDFEKNVRINEENEQKHHKDSTYYDENHVYNYIKGVETTENDGTWYESIDNSGRFLCKFCELKYSTPQTLRYHVKTKHPHEAAQIKQRVYRNKRNSILRCHICNQRFKEIIVLKEHLLSNHSLEDIKTSCPYCDATFSTENAMSNHMFIQHKKVTKSGYMCNICGYRTTTKSHYIQHQNTHLKDKINKCRYCDYATNYMPNLKIHERIHTNEKVYSCGYNNCEYKCTARSALRSHQLKHYPEKHEVYCDKCSYKTIYKQCLKRHSECHKRNSIRLKL